MYDPPMFRSQFAANVCPVIEKSESKGMYSASLGNFFSLVK
jgi:hypothetical protein